MSTERGPDFFFAAPTVGPASGTASADRPVGSARRIRLWWFVAVAVVLIGVVAVVVLVRRSDTMPISSPPPGGGTLTLPSVLGESRLKAADPQPRSFFDLNYPDYDPQDVRLGYYGDPEGGGIGSLMAIRGPYTDLIDIDSTASERTIIGSAQCAQTMLAVAGSDPTPTSGYTCWRTSGQYSMSLLTIDRDAQTTAEMLDEAWQQQ